jgi:hypothetical protein
VDGRAAGIVLAQLSPGANARHGRLGDHRRPVRRERAEVSGDEAEVLVLVLGGRRLSVCRSPRTSAE